MILQQLSWFLMWLDEVGFPAYLAAGLTYYAVRAALRIAREDRDVARRKDVDDEGKRFTIAVLSLSMASAHVKKLVVTAPNYRGDVERGILIGTATEISVLVDHALSQNVPNADVIEIAVNMRSVASGLRAFTDTDPAPKIPRRTFDMAIAMVTSPNAPWAAAKKRLAELAAKHRQPPPAEAPKPWWRRGTGPIPGSDAPWSPAGSAAPRARPPAA